MSIHPARSELLQQAADDRERRHAQALTMAELAASVDARLDRDEILPAREIAAALLGINARRRETYMNWANTYATYVQDDEAREKLHKLVKWTRLLDNELGDGHASRVRVDKALDLAFSRAWPIQGASPSAASVTSSKSTVHKVSGGRNSVLSREIELAIERAGTDDVDAVFAALQALATDDTEDTCLLGAGPSGGIKYRKHDGENDELSRKSLASRLVRREAKVGRAR